MCGCLFLFILIDQTRHTLQKPAIWISLNILTIWTKWTNQWAVLKISIAWIEHVIFRIRSSKCTVQNQTFAHIPTYV
ncbi:hypothetical protein D3C73_666180 [compost metagenome]